MHYGSFLYKLFFLFHILCVVIGFGSTFVWAALGARTRHLDPATSLTVNRDILRLSQRLSSPFIYAAGAFGIGLVILSDKGIKFSDTWISIGLALFVIGALVAAFVLVPTQKRMIELQEELVNADSPAGIRPTQVDEISAATRKTAGVGGFLHLIFLLIMIDMVWGSFHFHGL